MEIKNKIKTYKEWIKSHYLLTDYLAVGDIVDNELILWACEVLPPKTDTKTCVHMCEAVDFIGGPPRYITFKKISNKWVYTGLEPKINK